VARGPGALRHPTTRPASRCPPDARRPDEGRREVRPGLATVEYLAATLLDWAWHTLPAGSDPGDALAFEAAVLQGGGLALPAIPPRYRTTYFNHIFSSQYSAGYYSYIWSEVLDADNRHWFESTAGCTGPRRQPSAAKLLSKGGSVDPMAALAALPRPARRVPSRCWSAAA